MHNNGLKGPLWNITRKMNQNLKATIKTKDGPTRPISIKDSIRQGGVLSGIQYALLMDEIAKEISNQNKGCTLPNHQEKLGCLLWMDDVVLISDNKQEIQDLLHITNQVAGKYHLEFGEEKSKYMTIGTNATLNLKLGNMTLEKTTKYKYLGEIIHEKMNLEPNIKEARSKAEGALQTILAIAGDPLLKGIQMETIWKLVETCIIPIITYGSETWEPTKKETKSANQVLDSILKRILKLPTSTSREPLYIETGILDIEHTTKKLRIGMLQRVEKTKSDLLDKILQNPNDNSWAMKTKKIMNHINYQQTTEESKTTTKKKVKEAVNKAFHNEINESSKEKSKTQHLLNGITKWAPGKRPQYMTSLNRNQVSLIFKARTRMLPVKNNFRNQHKDNLCRGCKAEIESQQHVLQECSGIHKNDTTRVTPTQFFTEDIQTLQKTFDNIYLILKELEQSEVRPALTGTITRPGIRTHTR